LRTIVEVRTLTPEQALLKLPVDLEATILKIYTNNTSAFVHDGKRGIYLSIMAPERKQLELTQGQLIRIQGITAPGNFIPHIVANKLTVLRKSSLPKPFLMTKELHLDPSIDCSWVTLKGIVVASVPEGKAIALRVKCYGDTITNIILTRTPDREQFCKELVHRHITANVVAASKSNIGRQMVARIFHANSISDIMIDPIPADPPLVAISDLMRSETSKETIAKIEGTVTHSSGKNVYLEDGTGATMAVAKEEHEWQPGDQLTVFGIIEVSPFAPTLRTQSITQRGNSSPPQPIPIDAEQRPLPSRWHHSLVNLDADLLEIRASEKQTVLSCTSDGHVFEVAMPGQEERISEIQLGSKLNLTGICTLRSTEPDSFYHQPDGIALLARSSNDIRVLKSPPWWTLEKFLISLGILLVLAALSLIWIFVLRKQVKSQTELIGSQIEREVTVRERQRLARELHDTLEQNMGSLALQLTSAQRNHSMGKSERLEKCLTLAQKTLAYCQKESRESIYDLRRGGGDSTAEWHDELLLGEAEANGTKIESSTNGTPFPLETRTQHHVIKVIREASLNAIRHGKASLILVTHQYTNSELTVNITDNGCGFDSDAKQAKGHFGIIGMNERAKRAKGSLTISSQPGSGATIILKIPNIPHSS